MNTLTHEQFHHWLEAYNQASMENNPQTPALPVGGQFPQRELNYG
jgi:hypothetical protein